MAAKTFAKNADSGLEKMEVADSVKIQRKMRFTQI